MTSSKAFKINKGLFISALTVIVPILLQLFFVRYASYEIDKIVYGNFVILVTLVSALSAVLLTSPINAFLRYFNEAKKKDNIVNEFRSLLIPLNILGAIIVLIFAFSFDRFNPETVFFVFLLFVFLNNISLNKSIILQKMERQKYFYFEVIDKISRFFLPAVFYFLFENLNAMIIGYTAGYFCLMLISYFYAGFKSFKPVFHWRKIKIYILYSYPMLFMSLFSWIITFSDRYFIDYLLNTKEVAIYSLLSSTAGFCSVAGAIYNIYVNPIIYKLYSEDKKAALKKKYKYLILMTFLLIVGIIIFLLLPKIVFTILLEKEVVMNTTYFHTMFLLVISAVFGVLQTSITLIFVLIKRLNIVSVFWFIAALINLAGNSLIGKFGIIAAASSTAAAYLFILIACIVWILFNFKGVINAK